MGRLKILADGKTKQAQADARGKLFEALITKVLRHYGYTFGATPSVNYAGMEIDIDGNHSLTHIPIYAECKCHDTDVASHHLQVFFGKYMTKWFKDKRAQGLFIALPGINSHARGFYRDNYQQNHEITFQLLEEEQVLTAMYELDIVARPDLFKHAFSSKTRYPRGQPRLVHGPRLLCDSVCYFAGCRSTRLCSIV